MTGGGFRVVYTTPNLASGLTALMLTWTVARSVIEFKILSDVHLAWTTT